MSAATAKHIKDLSGWSGKAALYELSEPLEGHSLVVVSATIALFSGAETFIFPANEVGVVTDFGELPGSQRGTLEHADALRSAGYEVRAI